MKVHKLYIILAISVLIAACHHPEKPKNLGDNEKVYPNAIDSISVEESELTISVNDFFNKAMGPKYLQAAKQFDGSEAEFKTFYKKKFKKSGKDEWKWAIDYCEINDSETARVRMELTIVDNDETTEDEIRSADLYLRHKNEDWIVYDLVFF